MLRINNISLPFEVPIGTIAAAIPTDNDTLNAITETTGINIRDLIRDRTRIRVNATIPELILRPQDGNIQRGLSSALTQISAPMTIEIFRTPEKRERVAFEQVNIIANVNLDTNYSSANIRGTADILYFPLIDLVLDYLQSEVTAACTAITCPDCTRDCGAEAASRYSYDQCNVDCISRIDQELPFETCIPCEGLSFFDLECQRRRIECEARNANITAQRADRLFRCGTDAALCNTRVTGERAAYIASCAAEVTACGVTVAACETGRVGCFALRDSLPLLKERLRRLIPSTTDALCFVQADIPNICNFSTLVDNDTNEFIGIFRYPFNITFPSVGRRIGRVRITTLDYEEAQRELTNTCRIAYTRPGTLIRIRDQRIGTSILNATACYSRSTQSIVGKTLLSISGPQDILFFGNLSRLPNGDILLSDAEISAPPSILANIRFLTDFLTFESIEISESIVRALGLQPIFGKDVLDLLERAVNSVE